MSTVEDVSRILRRRCPSQKDIVEGSKHLKDHTDSLWFMEGEEDPDGDHDRRDTSDENLATVCKRRKLSAEVSRGNPPQSNDQHHLARAERAAFLESTTMQNRATFSCHSGGGFTSAAAQLHCIAEAGCDIRQTKTSRDRPRLPSGRRGALHGGEYANIGPKVKDKSNLLSLWGPKSTPSLLSDSNTKSCQETKGYCEAGARSHKGQVLHKGESQRYTASMHDQAQVIPTKKALRGLPPGLANHELYSRSHQTRHGAGEIDQTPQQYFFLSSSPPPANDVAPKQTNLNNDVGAAICTKAGLKKSLPEGESSGGNNRPANTFHTTSVAEAKEGAHHSKKTLGIRRSMTGWSCRGKPRFSIPAKAPTGI